MDIDDAIIVDDRRSAWSPEYTARVVLCTKFRGYDSDSYLWSCLDPFLASIHPAPDAARDFNAQRAIESARRKILTGRTVYVPEEEYEEWMETCCKRLGGTFLGSGDEPKTERCVVVVSLHLFESDCGVYESTAGNPVVTDGWLEACERRLELVPVQRFLA